MLDPVELFLNRLQHPVMAGIDLKLERVLRLMSLLGSPQKRLPPVIHVAGTNGKGSLIANLQAIFQAAGYRVHRYTSPHLVRFSERIILQGKEIDQAYMQSLLGHLAGILQQQPATFFEATTALAFLAFAEKPADILLLETGMGGRLDATNVVDKPLLTAITPVSFNHMNFLGNTIAEIAGEKAGILKKNVPCVVGRQVPEATAVIEKKAAELNAPIYRLGVHWNQENGQYRSDKRTLTLKPALAGAHQLDNAATAVACVNQLQQYTINDAHIAQGLASSVWPARLQKLESGKYARMLLPGYELWLDGGHNQQGGEVLAAWFKDRGVKDVHLICGLMSKKDEKAYLAPLAPFVQTLYAVAIPDEAQSLTPQQLAASAGAVGIRAEVAENVENALQTIISRAKTPAVIYICGSLYLAGKVLAAN